MHRDARRPRPSPRRRPRWSMTGSRWPIRGGPPSSSHSRASEIEAVFAPREHLRDRALAGAAVALVAELDERLARRRATGASGIVARSRVPAPGGLSTSSRAAERLDPVAEAGAGRCRRRARRRRRRRRRPRRAAPGRAAATSTRTSRRARVLDRVRERLGDEVVDRDLDGLRQPPLGQRVDPQRDRRVQRASAAQRRPSPCALSPAGCSPRASSRSSRPASARLLARAATGAPRPPRASARARAARGRGTGRARRAAAARRRAGRARSGGAPRRRRARSRAREAATSRLAGAQRGLVAAALELGAPRGRRRSAAPRAPPRPRRARARDITQT